MPNCPNCDEPAKSTWTHCPSCGANLKKKTYSEEDDPLAAIKERQDKMDEFLTEKFPDDLENAEETDDTEEHERTKPRKKSVAKKKRRTLFG